MEKLTNKLDYLFNWVSQLTLPESIFYATLLIVSAWLTTKIAKAVIGIFFSIVIAAIVMIWVALIKVFDRS